MTETIFSWAWVISGWIACVTALPRAALKDQPATTLLAVLTLGAFGGPLLLAPRVIGAAREALSHAR